MKKSTFIFVIALLILTGFKAFSQHLEIVPLVNYQFPAGVDATWRDPDNPNNIQYGRFRIKGDVNYGVGLNIPLPLRGVTVSASFVTMNSSLEFDPNTSPNKIPLFDARQEYWMFGILFALTLIVSIFLLRRMRIFQAIKLGETV